MYKLIIILSAFLIFTSSTKAEEDVSKKIAEIQKSLDAYKGEMDGRMAQKDEEIVELKKIIEGFKKTPEKPPIAPYIVEGDGDVEVVITNSWHSSTNVYLNEKWYSIPSKSTKIIKVHPGKMVYRVHEANQGLQERILRAGESFKIEVYPLK